MGRVAKLIDRVGDGAKDKEADDECGDERHAAANHDRLIDAIERALLHLIRAAHRALAAALRATHPAAHHRALILAHHERHQFLVGDLIGDDHDRAESRGRRRRRRRA